MRKTPSLIYPPLTPLPRLGKTKKSALKSPTGGTIPAIGGHSMLGMGRLPPKAAHIFSFVFLFGSHRCSGLLLEGQKSAMYYVKKTLDKARNTLETLEKLHAVAK